MKSLMFARYYISLFTIDYIIANFQTQFAQ